MPEPPRGIRKRELHKLVVARSDVNAARHACEVLLTRIKDLGDDLYMPLLYAAAISYGRPFSDNRPIGPLPGRWRRFDDPRLQKTHDDLLETRNKLVAHSDPAERTVDIYPPGAPLGKTGLVSGGVSVSIRLGGVFTIARFQDVYDTCMDLGGRLNDEVQALLQELYGNRELPKTDFPLTFDDGL